MKWLFFPAKRLSGGGLAATYRIASDLYKVFTDAIVGLAYFEGVSIVSSGSRSCGASAVIFAACVISLLKLLEIMLIAAVLALDSGYRIGRRDRAIVNTLWHYGEVSLCFGVLYIGALFFNTSAIVRDDSGSITDSFLGPLYFSVATLTTIGYGDFHPSATSWFCQTLMIFEVACGSFLLLVTLQRIGSIARRDFADELNSSDHEIQQMSP
ncbi:MAG: two pore domain potassium channel family protein [Planctomycetaceae bacterium]|nr:two pore domain potassium channel family protein [Planctomycetaceae bacterium]